MLKKIITSRDAIIVAPRKEEVTTLLKQIIAVGRFGTSQSVFDLIEIDREKWLNIYDRAADIVATDKEREDENGRAEEAIRHPDSSENPPNDLRTEP